MWLDGTVPINTALWFPAQLKMQMCIHKHNHTHSYLNRHFFCSIRTQQLFTTFSMICLPKCNEGWILIFSQKKFGNIFIQQNRKKKLKLNLIKLLSQDYFSVSFPSSTTDRKRILTNKWSVHLCNKGLPLPMSLHPSHHSKNSHHVIYLPHVDAL